jgi:hypothetical protein
MIATSDKQRVRLLGSFAFLAAIATCILNLRGFFWEPLPVLFGITIPALFIAGFVGTFFGSQTLRVAGWLGIAWFTLLILYIAVLTDDYIFVGARDGRPNVPGAAAFAWRILLFLTIDGSIIFCFKRLAKNSTALDS